MLKSSCGPNNHHCHNHICVKTQRFGILWRRSPIVEYFPKNHVNAAAVGLALSPGNTTIKWNVVYDIQVGASQDEAPARLLGVLLSARFRPLYEARFLSFRTQNTRIIDPELTVRKHFHLRCPRLLRQHQCIQVRAVCGSPKHAPALRTLTFLITGIREGHLPVYHILCVRILSFHADS